MVAFGRTVQYLPIKFIILCLLITVALCQVQNKSGKKGNIGSPVHKGAPTPHRGNNHAAFKGVRNIQTATRSRKHIQRALGEKSVARQQAISSALQEVHSIYKHAIKPMEELYRFSDIHTNRVSENEIYAKPMILFIGPWGVGKSTMINFLVGMEESIHKLQTGAEPTTSEFTVLMNGPSYRTVDGMVLAADNSRGFSALEQFGQDFLGKLQGLELPYKLLEKVTLVDTPGIIENRKQQERGYPFNEVMRWFVEQADLIFVLFDPTKLDVGVELEALFTQLKGRESQIRIILNKADSISTQELMRVYGALFWSMAPLINVTEPPRVYTGSYWEKAFRPNTQHELFLAEEIALLNDIYEVTENRVENKVAFLRSHAILVKIHALIVDKYLETYENKRSIFSNSEELLQDILEDPEKYHIFQSVLSRSRISKYDIPGIQLYQDFFTINAFNQFRRLRSHCSIWNGCAFDQLEYSISYGLPYLLNKFSTIKTCGVGYCP